MFLKPVSSLLRDWLVKVGYIAVALQKVKVKTMGRESERFRLLLLCQSVGNTDDNGVRRRKKYLKFNCIFAQQSELLKNVLVFFPDKSYGEL